MTHDIDEFFNSTSDTDRYFQCLFGDKELSAGRIVLQTMDTFAEPQYFTSAAAAAEYVTAKKPDDAFVSVGVSANTQAYGRGDETCIIALPGVYVDVDVHPDGCKPGKHNKQYVPSSIEEAVSILEEVVHRPNLIVASGGGVHAYWIFDKLWYFNDRDQAKAITYGWRQHVNSVFVKHKYTIDHVGDLARVLRVPGVVNTKHDKVVSILRDEVSDLTYAPHDFADYSVSPSEKSESAADYNLQMIDIPPEIEELLKKPSKLKMIWNQDESVSPPNDTSQSGWDQIMVNEAVRQKIKDPSVLWAMIREYRDMHCEDPDKAAKGLREAYAMSTIDKALDVLDMNVMSDPDDDFTALANGPWDDPARVVERVDRHTPHILYHLETFYVWGKGEGWEQMTRKDAEAMVYNECMNLARIENERAMAIAAATGKPGKLVKPSAAFLGNAMTHLKSEKNVSDSVELPAWISGHGPCHVDDVFPTQNGLLDIKKRRLIANTPNFFDVGRSACTFVPDAKCDFWENWLNEVFEGDIESIQLLQEWFGYLVSGRTHHQKMLFMGGATRAGKGTIGQVMMKVVGPSRSATPSLQSLGQSFGLEPLMHARLAFFGDVRQSRTGSDAEVLQSLLGWVGGDSFNINRKFRSTINGFVPRARFTMAFNGLPNFREESAALVNRVLYLKFTISNANKEDHQLLDKILSELSGILNWSLDGLERLNKRGHFVNPERSAQAIKMIQDTGSPLRSFVDECCVLGKSYVVSKKKMYDLYHAWALEEGTPRPLNKVHFYRHLYAVIPTLGEKKLVVDGEKTRVLTGVKVCKSPQDFDFID